MHVVASFMYMFELLFSVTVSKYKPLLHIVQYLMEACSLSTPH